MVFLGRHRTSLRSECDQHPIPKENSRATAVRQGDEYVINGSKTFISNELNADIIVVVCKTDPNSGAKGMSLIEADRAGFRRGRKLKKIGGYAADTAELFFADVRVPVSNLLGEQGKGFAYLMGELPQERLSIAASAPLEAAFDHTLAYVKERTMIILAARIIARRNQIGSSNDAG